MKEKRILCFATAILAFVTLLPLVTPAIRAESDEVSEQNAVAARYHLRNRTRNFYRSSTSRSRTVTMTRSRRG
ncbi:hypothetical protein LOC67_07260 [Stieleria sp. JC731]|uniref:hypothetical protein n=1 Tax=Pirellulaceae TaxID=2691357 RepID=UPI001E545F18|nr:hypothetical protein [Stieleria sp. JC731]MCC9600355.1 hypothetical protein [Stieleria sp. JC731]